MCIADSGLCDWLMTRSEGSYRVYVSSCLWSINLKNEAAYGPCRLLRYRYKVHNCENTLTERGTMGCKTRDIECHLATEPELFLAYFYLNKPSSAGIYPTQRVFSTAEGHEWLESCL